MSLGEVSYIGHHLLPSYLASRTEAVNIYMPFQTKFIGQLISW